MHTQPLKPRTESELEVITFSRVTQNSCWVQTFFTPSGATAPAGQGSLIIEVSRSHSDTPQSVGLPGRVISPTQRPLRANTRVISPTQRPLRANTRVISPTQGPLRGNTQMISPTQRPLPDNTRHSQETDIDAPEGIRTRSSSTCTAEK
jgi:hypothetical protein